MSEKLRHHEDDKGGLKRLWGFLVIAVASVAGAFGLKEWAQKKKQKYK